MPSCRHTVGYAGSQLPAGFCVLVGLGDGLGVFVALRVGFGVGLSVGVARGVGTRVGGGLGRDVSLGSGRVADGVLAAPPDVDAGGEPVLVLPPLLPFAIPAATRRSTTAAEAMNQPRRQTGFLFAAPGTLAASGAADVPVWSVHWFPSQYRCRPG
jgi:hypothetical protein